MMELSDEGYRVLHEREGLKLEAYLDTRGILTIGLAHTSAAGPPRVYQGMKITEEEAEVIFQRDIERFRDEIRPHIAPGLTVDQHEFDAIVSFVYNIGSTQFLGSTFLKRLNAGDHAGAAEALLWWNKPPEIVPRRRGEYFQFKAGLYVARADENGRALA